MAEYPDREYYIPVRKADLAELLLADPELSHQQRSALSSFSRLVGTCFHLHYHRELESLKDMYAPFDPDSETKPLNPPSAEEKERKLEELFNRFESLMQRGNFHKLSWEEVEEAMMGGSTRWGVNLHIEPGIFEHIHIFGRGNVVSERTSGWLFKKLHKVDSWQRLVLIIKLRKHKSLRKTLDTSHVFLKIFKDIPKLDLEMLLPGGRLKWPLFKKWTFWGLMSANIGYLLFSLWAKLLAVAMAIAGGVKLFQQDFGRAWTLFTSAAVLGPVAVLGGFSYRQYASYQSTKQNYALMLTESLYYQNLDNNLGVLTRLLDEAEEQECREVLLAYYFLLKEPAGLDQESLDSRVEEFLEKKVDLKVDFEIDDALAKLETIGLIEKQGRKYKAIPLPEALQKLESKCLGLMAVQQEPCPIMGAGGKASSLCPE